VVPSSPSTANALREIAEDELEVLPPVAAGVPQPRPLRVGMISNPRSGRNARRGLLVAARQLLHNHPQVARFEEDDLDGVIAAVRQMVEREIEIIVVSGGDGTVKAVLTGLFRSRLHRLPLLAILPGGTTNTTAHNLGYGRRPLRALQRLLSQAALGRLAGTVEGRAVLRADTGIDPQPLYAMFFGAGAVYHGIVFARRQLESRGLRGASGAALALLTFLGKVFSGNGGTLFPPLHAEVSTDGVPLAKQAYFGILASTMDRQILNVSPYWGSGPGPLRFSSLAYHPRHLARAVIPLLRGRPSPYLRPEFGYHSVNAHEVQMTFDSRFTLDGELFAPQGDLAGVTLSAHRRAYFLRSGGG
jgi:diacylglycerol kinase (ATP)